MASKRPSKKAAASPPPPAPRDDDEDSSAEEEEEEKAPPKKSTSNPSKPTSTKEKSQESSSGDDDVEEDGEEAESESSSEEEDENDGSKSQPPPKSAPPESESSSSGGESDSEPEKPISAVNRHPDPSIKPISSKPMEKTPKRQLASEPSELESATKKSNRFNRVWSEEDEIKILEVIAAYHAETGTDPAVSKEMDAIYERMKRSLGPEINQAKLCRKIQELRRMFRQKASQAEKQGRLKFARPHAQALYELSQKIWGGKDSDNKANGSVSPQKKRKKVNEDESVAEKKKKQRIKEEEEEEKEEPVEADGRHEFLMKAILQRGNDYMSELAIRRAMKSANSTKVKILEKKLLELQMIKMNTHLEWLDVVSEATELVRDEMKKEVDFLP